MKKHITHVYPRDREAMTAFSKVGYLSHEQLSGFFREKRIENYCRDGLLQREVYCKPGCPQTKMMCYKLSSAGREFCRKGLGMTNMYKSQNPLHDIPLANKYFTLTTEERATWRTEEDLREIMFTHVEQLRNQGDEIRAVMLQEMLENHWLSMPDCSFTLQGIEIAFEITTNSYGAEEINAKEMACQELNLNLQFERG